MIRKKCAYKFLLFSHSVAFVDLQIFIDKIEILKLMQYFNQIVKDERQGSLKI